MKLRKLLAIFFVIIMAALALAGCGSSSDTSDDTEEKYVTGTMVDITTDNITIKENDGTELTFDITNCEHDFENGLREGNWVTVTYTGEIDGTDTSGVTVIKITDNDEEKNQEAKDSMQIEDVDETVYATAGVHVRASYSTDSDVIGSLAKGDSIERTGKCANGWSRVKYNGEDAYIYGDYLSTEKPKKDAPAAKTDGSEAKTPQKGDKPADVNKGTTDTTKHKTVTGTVVDASMNTLTVTVNGKDYTVSAKHKYKNGIAVGNEVKITYTGKWGNNATIVKVEDNDPNADADDSSANTTDTTVTSNDVPQDDDSGDDSGSALTVVSNGTTVDSDDADSADDSE